MQARQARERVSTPNIPNTRARKKKASQARKPVKHESTQSREQAKHGSKLAYKNADQVSKVKYMTTQACQSRNLADSGMCSVFPLWWIKLNHSH